MTNFPSNISEGVHCVRNFDHSHGANFPVNSKGAHCIRDNDHSQLFQVPSLPGHISCVKSISLSGFLHVVFTKMARSNTSISYPLI